jgi:hypothetical protein
LNRREIKWQENGEKYVTKYLNLYSSPNIIKNIESRRMWLAGYIAYMGGRGMLKNFIRKTRKKETSGKI